MLPLGYFITWGTYGSWLPGDDRGWVDKHCAAWHVPIQEPDPALRRASRERMIEPPLLLNRNMRSAVEHIIRLDCQHRGYILRAVSARSNHVHVVVSAGDVTPDRVLNAFKSHSTRTLKKMDIPRHAGRRCWWEAGGSKRYLNDEASLMAAIRYVQQQDITWQKSHEPRLGRRMVK